MTEEGARDASRCFVLESAFVSGWAVLVHGIADGRERGMYETLAFVAFCETAGSTAPTESTSGVRVTVTLRENAWMHRHAA